MKHHKNEQIMSNSHGSHESHAHHIEDFKRRFVISLMLTVPILLFSETIQSWFRFTVSVPYREWLMIILATVIYFYGGYPFIKGTKGELLKRKPGMMTLIGTAITVAFFYSVFSTLFGKGKAFFWELATLIDVMLLGHWIEMKSILGASQSLEELVKLMPTEAHRVEQDGSIVEIQIHEVKPGDILLVRPGEKIPTDGIVIEGESYVDESLLTGESIPVKKTVGSKVIGGSINEKGVLRIKVHKVGEETYLSQVLKIVKEAQESRSKTQDLADKTAGYLFYIALGVGLLTFGIWFRLKSPEYALERMVTVLVIACPHALGLAIPLVVAISTAITARKGILIRDRRAFESIRNVDTIIFDKTGTLTEGKFGVVEVVSIIDEKDFLSLVYSLEQNSEHIIAKSISEFIKKMGLKPRVTKEFKAIPGFGVHGLVDGKEVYVGGPNLLKKLKIKSNIKIKSRGTIVYGVVDGKVVGAIVLADRIRESSRKAVSSLKGMGIKIYMLTGDNKVVAKWVAEELGIDEYFAEVLPHEKAAKVEQVKSQGRNVAMVGDGINDAPALVSADVGIAIGAGTDVAIESADIVLVKNNPESIVELIKISQRTYRKMVQNLWWAAGYNIITIPLAAGILYSAGVVINPAVGAALMSISTVIVAVNSQTLRKEKSNG